MRRAFTMVVVALGLPLAALGAEPAPKPTSPPPKAAPVAEAASSDVTPLSELARRLLRRRMERHGRDLSTLGQAVVLLQLEVAQELAQGVAKEPRIVRPTPDSTDELNTQLPERFFLLQDELRDRARTLAQAAGSKDPQATAAAYGTLLQTCVSCHRAFLRGALP